VQVVVRKAAADQHRHPDRREIGHQGLPERVAQRVGVTHPEYVVGLPGVAAHPQRPDPDEAVLLDATRKRQVPVNVGETLPWANGTQGRRPQCGGAVLADGEIGHPEHDDATIAPGLAGRPLHDVIDVLALLLREQLAGAIGTPTAAEVGVDHRESLRHPPGRVRGLPAGQRREGDRAWLTQHAISRGVGPSLAATRRQIVLAVRVGAHNHRMCDGAGRPEHVDPQHRSVAGGHRGVVICDDVGVRFGDGHRGCHDGPQAGHCVARRARPPPRAVEGGRR
jgi:hypothetical protein